MIPIEIISGQGLKGEIKEIQIGADSPAIGKAIYELKLPMEYLIILLMREGEYIQPNGSLVLKKDDILLSLSEEEVYRNTLVILNGQHDSE
jgi:Trk K+ transport system NAD-binding subunit